MVNRERKKCEANFYESKIQQLKGEHLRKWWSEVNCLSNMKATDRDILTHSNVDEFSNLTEFKQANAINLALLVPLEEFRLTCPLIPFALEESPEFLKVTEMRVQKVLSKLDPYKGSGPDKIPDWLLRKYSF